MHKTTGGVPKFRLRNLGVIKGENQIFPSADGRITRSRGGYCTTFRNTCKWRKSLLRISG